MSAELEDTSTALIPQQASRLHEGAHEGAPEPAATHSEEGTSSWRTWAGWAAPLLALALWFTPLPLSAPAHRLAAITAAVLLAWVTEVLPLPVTALAIAPALVLTGIMPAKQAFAPFADPILFLFVGSFFMARAMTRHGLDQRLAHGIADLPWVRGRPARLQLAMLSWAMITSMWISNTGTTAILLPVLLGMLSVNPALRSGNFATGTVLAIAHASTTGGLATLVGTPPNAITARILKSAGIQISFLDWMKVGVPAMLAMSAAVYGVLRLRLPCPTAVTPVSEPREGARPWSRAELVTAASFGLAVFGWILPDLLQLTALPSSKWVAELLEPGAVAVTASMLLFLLPARRGGERVLTWDDAVRIDWGLILLFGGGIALGEAMFQTGLARALGEGMLAVTGVSSLWSLTATTLVLAVVLTEICSNTAAANMLLPLVIGAAQQLGVSPIPPALAVGFGASCGFMLPVATGPNALAYGAGLASAKDMIRVGVLLDLLAVLILFVLLRVLCPLLSWT